MMETLPMACMQHQFFQPNPVAPIRPSSCKGVPNSHWIMKHSPNHEELQFGDLGEIGFADNFPFGNTYTDLPCYDNDQLNSMQQSDCITITAINKSPMVTDLDDNWNGRHPNSWTSSQAFSWLGHVCAENNIEYERLRCRLNDANIQGETLVTLTKDDFLDLCNSPEEGDIIYRCLQNLKSPCTNLNDANNMYPSYQAPFCQWPSMDAQNNNVSHIDDGSDQLISNTTSIINGHGRHLIDNHHQMQPNNYFDSRYLIPVHGGSIKSEVDSEGESNQSYNTYTTHYHHDSGLGTTETPDLLQKRKRGRPLKDKKKNKNGQRSSRLWEFIRDLLLDSKTCPSLLKWENVDEGVFRFVQSDKVARLWGERKCNPRMTYEKLSRAMRYYYKSQVFQPVIGRRLVYKFGPNATGWRPI